MSVYLIADKLYFGSPVKSVCRGSTMCRNINANDFKSKCLIFPNLSVSKH